MPCDPSAAPVLAPSQLYIVLAFTIATFSWLLGPDAARRLSLWNVVPCLVLVLVQIVQVAFYTHIGPGVNTHLHRGVLGGYFILAGWLFVSYWTRSLDGDPESLDEPEDLDEPVVGDEPGEQPTASDPPQDSDQ